MTAPEGAPALGGGHTRHTRAWLCSGSQRPHACTTEASPPPSLAGVQIRWEEDTDTATLPTPGGPFWSGHCSSAVGQPCLPLGLPGPGSSSPQAGTTAPLPWVVEHCGTPLHTQALSRGESSRLGAGKVPPIAQAHTHRAPCRCPPSSLPQQQPGTSLPHTGTKSHAGNGGCSRGGGQETRLQLDMGHGGQGGCQEPAGLTGAVPPSTSSSTKPLNWRPPQQHNMVCWAIGNPQAVLWCSRERPGLPRD